MKEMKKGLPTGIDKVFLVPITTMNTADYVKAMTLWRAELDGVHCYDIVIGKEKPPVQPAPLVPGVAEAMIDQYWEEMNEWQIDQAIYQEKSNFILAKMKSASLGLPSLLEEVTSVTEAWNKLKATYIQATPQTRNTIYKEWLEYKLMSGMAFDVWWNNFEKLRRTIDEVSENCHPAIPKITEQEIIDNIIVNTPDEFNHAKERIREDEATRITFKQFLDMIQRKGRDLDNIAINGQGGRNLGGKRKFEANVAFLTNGKTGDAVDKPQETAIYGNYKGKIENTYSHKDKLRGRAKNYFNKNRSTSPKAFIRNKQDANANDKTMKYVKGKYQREFQKFGNLKKIDKTTGYKEKYFPKVTCYHCGEMGHYKNSCPTLKMEKAKKEGKPFVYKGLSAIFDSDGRDENGMLSFYTNWKRIAEENQIVAEPAISVDAEDCEVIGNPMDTENNTVKDDSSKDDGEKKLYGGKMKLLKHKFMEFELPCEHVNFMNDDYKVYCNDDKGIGFKYKLLFILIFIKSKDLI
jgi:hypothetical protein